MTPQATAVWHKLPADWATQLSACCARADSVRGDTTAVFFRADDVAVPGRQLQRLLEIFIRHKVPLGLAVVPAWLTSPRWNAISRMGASGTDLWCWHQHGWRHRNHEPRGKKQEFGPFRSADALQRRPRSRPPTVAGHHGDRLFPHLHPSLEPLFGNHLGTPAGNGI
jgi:hypothetical protein